MCDHCFGRDCVCNVAPKIHVVGITWEVSLVVRGCMIRSGWMINTVQTFASAGWGDVTGVAVGRASTVDASWGQSGIE